MRASTSLQGVVKYVETINKQRKPIGWGPMWPVNSLVVEHRRNDLSLVSALGRSGFKLICCTPTNEEAIRVQHQFQRKHPTLKTFRYISKGQNLTEQVDSLGVQGFKVAYYAASCPYALGAINKAGTLQTLESALVAAGVNSVSAEELFQEHFENYICDLPDANHTEVWFFTNAAFQARLTSFRTTWWEALGLVRDRQPLGPYDPNTERNRLLALGLRQIAVLFIEPPAREFDDFRFIREEDVDELKSALKSYPKARLAQHQPQWWFNKGYTEEWGYGPEDRELLAENERLRYATNQYRHLHAIGMQDGRHVEYRPVQQVFGKGIGRGFTSRSEQPKLIVLTSKPDVSRQAVETLSTRQMVKTFKMTSSVW